MSREVSALRRWLRGRMIEVAIALALTAVALGFAIVRVASAERGAGTWPMIPAGGSQVAGALP